MMDIERFADAMLGNTGDDEQAALGQMDALAEDVLRYDEYRAARDQDLGLQPVGRTSEEQFVDGATYDPTRDEMDAKGRRTVPLQALHSERAKRQELSVQTELLRQQSAQLEGQIADLERAMTQRAQQPAPDYDADPKGYIEQRERQFAEQLGQVQQQQQIAAISRHAEQAEQAVVREVGAEQYQQAFIMVNQSVAEQIRQQVPGISEPELQQALARGLLVHSAECMRRGLNPAQVIYQHAHKLGFRARGKATVPSGSELEQLWQQSAVDNAPWPWR